MRNIKKEIEVFQQVAKDFTLCSEYVLPEQKEFFEKVKDNYKIEIDYISSEEEDYRGNDLYTVYATFLIEENNNFHEVAILEMEMQENKKPYFPTLMVEYDNRHHISEESNILFTIIVMSISKFMFEVSSSLVDRGVIELD